MSTRYVERPEVERLANHEAIHHPLDVSHLEFPFIGIGQDKTEIDFGEPQVIRVGVAEPDKPAGVLLVPVAWSDYSRRPFQEIRLGAIARYTNLRVIGIDYPGMGNVDRPEGNGLTKTQVKEARKGRMTNLTERYWDAITNAGLLNVRDRSADSNHANLWLPVAISGNSLGSFTATELAATAPEGVEITDIHWSELMALKKVPIGVLAARTTIKGAPDLDVYMAANYCAPDFVDRDFDGLKAQIIAQKKSHWYSARTLSRGKQLMATEEALEREIISIDKEHGTTVHIVSAEKGLSPKSELIAFSDYMHSALGGSRSTGKVRRSVLPGEYHGYQDNLAAVLHQLSQLSIVQSQS